MTLMEDSNSINVNNDHHAQNTDEKAACHTVQDNCVTLITENTERVLKVKPDLIDDCTRESRIDIINDDHLNSLEASFKNQDVSENNPELNDDDTNHNGIFSCDICKNKFVLNYQLKMHMEKQHKKSTPENSKSNECKFCRKQFKLNFVLNRHIEKCHANLTECEICKCIVEKSVFNEHMQTHENGHNKKINAIPHLKLCKLNGVWKSKPNCMYECKICFEKLDSQITLTEHMKIHEDTDNNQIQFVDKLNDHVEFDNESQFKCQKCSLIFDNRHTLNIHTSHCTKSSQNIWSKFRKQVKDNVKTSYHCTNCETSYANPLLLKNHMTLGCKNHSCVYCGTVFNTKELWLKHMDNFEKYKNCIESNVNSIKTSVLNGINQNVNNENNVCINITVRNLLGQIDNASGNSNESTVQNVSHNLMANDSGVNITNENSQCTNVTEINNSDLTGTVSSIESIVPGESQNTILSKIIVNIKKEKGVTNTAVKSSLGQIDTAKNNEIIELSVTPHNSIINYCDVNVKREKNSSTINSKINNVDQINTVNSDESISESIKNCLFIKKEKISSIENVTCRNDLTDAANCLDSTAQVTSQNSIMNNCDLNIKKEKCLDKNVKENKNSNLIDSSNRINEPNEERTPQINMMNNIRVKREPEEDNHKSMSTIKETEYFSIKKLPNNENVIYLCNICNTSLKDSYSNLHSFAVHMSCHLECSLHECVVCDETFSTVLLWTNHMTSHQQQEELIFSNTQSNSTDIENNFNTTTYPESIESVNQDFSSSIKTVNNCVNKSINSLSCDQAFHDKSKQIRCKYCDRTFTSRGPCTNHERSHDPNGYKNAVRSMKRQSIEIPNTIQSETLISNPNLNIRKKKNKLVLKSKHSFCDICHKKFAKRCYLTNHMKIRHRVEPTWPKKLVTISSVPNSGIDNINGKKSINECKKNELSTELGTNLLLSVDKISNDIDSEILYQQSASTSHLTTHSTKIYTCKYCKKQFNVKSSYSNHIKIHSNIKYKRVKSVNRNNINTVKVERNEENQQEEHYYSTELDNSSLIEPNSSNALMNAALSNHMIIHSNHKLYKCQFCDREFIKKSSYSNHIKSHSNQKYKKVKSVNTNNLNTVKIKENEKNQQENHKGVGLVNSSFIETSIENLTRNNRLWFPCDVCEKKFSTPFHLIVHRRLHCGIEPYLCKICNRCYTVRHRWNRHLKSHYLKNKLKQKNYKQSNVLKLDTSTLKTESIQQQSQFKCGYCKKEYYLISHWKKHLSLSKECRRHCKSSLPEFTSNQARENFTKITRFECHICLKTYSTTYNRKIHLINVHKMSLADIDTRESTNVIKQREKSKKETIQQIAKLPNLQNSQLNSNNNGHQCNICGKSYSNKPNLYRHHTLSHTTDSTIIECSICNRSFKHKYSFREHLKSKHKQLLQYNRKIMGKKIGSNFDYKNYVAQYSCEMCKVKFFNKVSLENHKKNHAFYEYDCRDCGLKFETIATLGEHIMNVHTAHTTLNDNNHTEIHPTSSLPPINDNVKCKICSKVMKSAKYLPIHMRIHSGVKPFKCEVCNMAFRFKPNLRIHKKIHNQASVSS